MEVSDEGLRSGLVDRVPAPAIFFVSGVTMYFGAVVAVRLFERLSPPAVGWWRVLLAAVVLLLWRRPWRLAWTRRTLALAAAFGLALAVMNLTFYLAISYLPLGIAVSIEFIGPVTVAALTGRGWRERVGIAIAAAGVVLLAGVAVGGADDGARPALGLAAIAVAAACWAAYIVLGKRVAVARAAGAPASGVDSLSIGMAAGAVLMAPFFAGTAGTVVVDPSLLGWLLLVAVCSSVIPYGLDQLVLRRVGTARFAVLLAMLPATALLVGWALLGQTPSWLALLGLVLITGAIALTSVRSAA